MNEAATQAVSAFDIETARLRLRPLDESDEALYCDLYTDAQVMRFIGSPWSRETAQRNFRRVLAEQHREPPARLFLVILERSSGQAIGLCGISRFDAGRKCAEVGIVLKPAAWGMGFGKEGLAALVELAFSTLQVDEIRERHSGKNASACGLVDRLRFVPSNNAMGGDASDIDSSRSLYRHTWCVARSSTTLGDEHVERD